MKIYAVAIFPDKNGESVNIIPQSWITVDESIDVCIWPNAQNVSKLIENCTPPSTAFRWKKHKVILVRENIGKFCEF